MRPGRGSLAIGLVAALLGALIVVQFRAQTTSSGLEGLSAQELTVLVANLNTRNDQLRTEVATLEQEAQTLTLDQARGQTSVGQLETDLARVRAWAGLVPVAGPGVRVTVAGPLPGGAVEDLINELLNAGAEAMAVERTRVVVGTAVSGSPDQLTVEGRPFPDPFDLSAIGNPEALTGSLTRAGGIVAQFAATYPDVQLTVTPLTTVQLPATTRSLTPVHGHPKL